MADSEFYSGSKKFQYLAAASANLGAFGLGTVLGWSSPGIPSLEADDTFSYLKEDANQKALLGSLVPIGALAACLITGYLIGRLGRKTTMLITTPVFILGWLLLAFAQNFGMLASGRFLTGFSGGAFSLAAPVYVGETAEAKLRGTLGSGFQLMVVLGILFAYCVGALIEWNWLSLVCAFIPVVFAVCMFFMPESPRYYVIKNRISDASDALMKLRGAHSESVIAPELAAIKASVAEASRNQATFKDLLQPSILKPTSLSLALMFFQQMSGINAVIFYQSSIFEDAGSELNANTASIIVGVVQVIATVVSTVLVDRAGRKILLVVSDVFMGLSLVGLGVFFYLKDANDPIVEDIGLVPLISMIVFIVAFSLGFGPIPWMMVGEILPPRALGPASSVATVFNWFLAFLVTQFFEGVNKGIGADWSYWTFAIVCGVGTLFIIFVLPETKGKSLDEIQALFGSPERLSNRTYDTYQEGTSNPGFQPDEK